MKLRDLLKVIRSRCNCQTKSEDTNKHHVSIHLLMVALRVKEMLRTKVILFGEQEKAGKSITNISEIFVQSPGVGWRLGIQTKQCFLVHPPGSLSSSSLSQNLLTSTSKQYEKFFPGLGKPFGN